MLRGRERVENIDNMLPQEGYEAGMHLESITAAVDPIILYDSRGLILKQWRDGYIPSLTELSEVIKYLTKE